MEKMYLTLLILSMILLTDAAVFDLFHCRAATCQQFYYGLRRYSRRDDYVNVCYGTVNSLLQIAQQHGKCYDEAKTQFNSACIIALATTMRNCVHGLKDVPENEAQYFCGHKLMQNCAKQVGLERFPFKTEYRPPAEHDDDYYADH
ncbi:hypothetical protein I4U23_003374 [Adineta vaga]|nr:hypothetical protein I4U23_003374 [Adineta vaga]